MAAAFHPPLISSSRTTTTTLIPPPSPPPSSPTRPSITANTSLSLLTPRCATGLETQAPRLPQRHPFTPRSTRDHSIWIPQPTTGALLCFQEIGLNEREAEALLGKHPSLAFASLESLRCRIDSLRSVGLSGLALHRAVAKRPEILTSSAIGPFLDFVRKELRGLEPAKLERLLASTDPRILTGFAGRAMLLIDHGVPREKLPHVLNNVDIKKVFCERSIKEIEEMIDFLKGYGWPELIIRRPTLLNLDLYSQLMPRVEFLTQLGGGDREAAAFLINKLPAILSYTVEHFQSHLEFWLSVGLTDREVFRIALIYPNIFSVSRERKLQPRIEFLRQCGFNAEDIFKFLIKAPLFLSLSFKDNLAKKLTFLVKIGYRHRTRALALALGAATRTSCENMQMVIGLFFNHGLSCVDVLAMSRKHPQVLQYNHESLEKKMEFLIEGMEREVGELLAFPAFLGYKLDDRIKHRYEVKKDVRGKGMSLNKLLSVSTKKFYLSENSTEMQCNHDLATMKS